MAKLFGITDNIKESKSKLRLKSSKMPEIGCMIFGWSLSKINKTVYNVLKNLILMFIFKVSKSRLQKDFCRTN